MTVTTNTNKVQALGNGATKTFPYSFRIYSASELVVTSTDLTTGVDTPLVLNTDYTVTGAGSYNGGNVVLTGDAPPNTTRITIRRVVPVTQGADLRNQGAYFAETHEDVFDKLTMVDQQQQEVLDRSLTLPESASGVSAILPLPSASRAIKWNAAGTALENSDVDPDELVTAAAAQVALATEQAELAAEQAENANTAAGTATGAAGSASTSAAAAAASANLIANLQRDGLGRVVTSIAALRALDKTANTKACATGYYADGDGGGGFYYYDAADTTSADNGGTVIVAADGGRWKLAVTDTVSAKQFGAKGDGATNDAAVLQAAITAAAAAGKILLIPAGTYILGATSLSLANNSVIVGEGSSTNLVRSSATIARVLDATGRTNVAVRDLRISYTAGTSLVSAYHAALYYTNCTNVSAVGVHVEGLFYCGIVFEGCTDATADRCNVRGVENRALYAYQVCTTIKFVNCSVNGYNVGGTTATTQYGININPAGLGTMFGVVVSNNSVENCISQGIASSERVVGVSITGNYVRNITAGHGILVQEANTFTGQYTVVTGNTIYGAAQHGIYLQTVNYVSVTGNQCVVCGISGIRVRNSGFCTVVSNSIQFSTSSDLYFEGTSNRCTVTGNILIGAPTGLRLEAGTALIRYNDNIIYSHATANITDSSGTNSAGTNITT